VILNGILQFLLIIVYKLCLNDLSIISSSKIMDLVHLRFATI